MIIIRCIDQPADALHQLGPVDQISYAVANLDEALPVLELMFGPFTVRTVSVNEADASLRGIPTGAVLRVAFGRSGDLQIEAIEVVDGDAAPAEFLRKRGGGIHHVRFTVPDLEASRSFLATRGFELFAEGQAGDVAYCFLQPPVGVGASAVELIQRFDPPAR